MANNKDFEKDFKLPDTKALSEAYTEYLDSVTFGGKPIGEEKKKPEAVSMAKVDETEKSSTVHDEIVEKIVRKNKALSHSIWTDEPVLKPKKSVWLNTDDDNEEALKKAEKVENSQSVQKAQEKNAEEKASDNEVIIPFSEEKNHINGTKKEISVAVSADGTVKKLPNKKNFVLKIPDSYYREYDAAAQDKGPVIAGKRVEIIDKRSPEKKPENAQKPSRVEATINVRVPVQKEQEPVRKAEKKAEKQLKKEQKKIQKKEEKEVNIVKDLLFLCLYILIVIGICWAVLTYVGQRTEVSGESMSNTLHSGDTLWICLLYTSPSPRDA